MNKSSPIAVIGISAMFPDAANLKEYWNNIVTGHDAIKPIPVSHWKPEDLYDADPKRPDFTYAKTGGFLKPYDFDPLKFGIAPHAIEATDTTQLLGMVCAHEALIDAGYGPERDFNKERTSCIIGVTGTLELVIPLGARLSHPVWKKALKNAGIADELAAGIVEEIADSFVPWQENSFPGLLGNVVAGRIASRLDLGGSNAVVDAACASSLAALSMAVMELESGRADMVITGGMDTFNDIFMYMCFSKTPALSPTGHSRPFDADGDGTAIGEGLGTLILKRLDDAERDGDRIYAVIKGVGSGSDGKGQAIYAPAAKGQIKALSRAYQAADVTPETVELLEAHGTGTKVGDGVEISALAEVYGESGVKHCVIGSVKSQIGHTKAAAGAAGLIKAVMALHHKIQPPSLKVRALHAGLAKTPFQVLDEARPWIPRGNHPRRAAVSAFGFGGSNFHCVVEEYKKAVKPVSWDDEIYFFGFSAKNQAELLSQLMTPEEPAPARLAILARRSRACFEADAPFRLTLWAKGEAELLNRFAKAREVVTSGTSSAGIAYGEGPAETELSIVFAGQGSQTIGMLRDLILAFPESLVPLEIASRILREEEGDQGPSLIDFIYPPQAFGEERKTQQKALTATRIAQLALGSVGAALFLILQRFGVKATQFAGHSYGELLALYAAGSLRLEEMLAASYRRGYLMEKAGASKAGGGMLAVMSSADSVQKVLADGEFAAQIANYNSAEQVVVGGSLTELARLKTSLKNQGIVSKALDVSTAFHTDFVSAAANDFDAWLGQNVSFAEPEVSVFGNRMAQPYSLVGMQTTLSTQLASPVRFHEMLGAMKVERGTLVEVGPGRKILGLLRSANPSALSLDSDAKSSVLGLVGLLGELAARGHKLNLSAWHPGLDVMPDRSKKAFTVSLTGANYRSPAKSKQKETVVQRPPKIAVASELGRSHAIPSSSETSRASVEDKGAKPARELPLSENTIIMTKTTREASMTKNNNLSSLESILREMQEAQRRTTDAHSLFLENQRQFQSLMREALVGSPIVGTSPVLSPRREVDRERPDAAPIETRVKSSVVAPSRAPVEPLTQEAVPRAPLPVAAPSPAKAPRESILALIAEATGFPIEMLAEDMQLESDLGMDSIKKVEIFSQLQSRNPEIKLDATQMNEAQTIRDLTRLFSSSAAFDHGTSKSAQEGERQGAWSASPLVFVAGKSRDARPDVLEVISEKTGFPVEMLADEMDLESDLGVDSIKKVEIFSALGERFPEVPFSTQALGELHRIVDIVGRIQGTEAPKVGGLKSSAVDARALLWDVIAEKTGYPSEVLSLGMDLEADLGIDSIKRVEILSALSEKSPVMKNLPVSDVRTLNDLLILLEQDQAEAIVHPKANDEELADSLLHPESSEWDLSAKKKMVDEILLTRIETGDFERPLNQDFTQPSLSCWKLKPTAWAESARRDFRSSGEIWILDDGNGLAKDLCVQLEARGAKPKRVASNGADPILVPKDLQGLIIVSPGTLDHDPFLWYKDVYRFLQKTGEILSQTRGFVATVSRLGGDFGLDGLASLNEAFAGGLSSLVKTISHEWPEVHTRAIDIGRDFTDPIECADRCLDAILRKGPLEIGVFRSRSITPKLYAFDRSFDAPEKVLEAGDTVLVTGGARGVTAATVRHLAKRYPVRYVIWGRTDLSPEEPRELRDLSDVAQIKRQLLKMRPELLHPRDLERAYSALVSARELKANLSDLRSLGAEVIYEAVDVGDESRLRGHLQNLTSRYPRIRGIIHGAGVLRDKLIVDQTDEELDSVLDTKLRLLPYFEHLAEGGSSWMIYFSSSTARLGRKGQGAYGLANEILNRSAAYFASKFDMRVLSFNWGPWDGGMVNANLKKLFASEGLGTIPVAAGAALQTYLLEHSALGSGEWLVLGEGGEDIVKDHLVKAETILEHRSISVSAVPVLLDHVIKNHAVVPAALLLEWMAIAAAPYFLGKKLFEAKDFKVFKGLVLDARTELEIEIVASEQSEYHMECKIRSTGDQGQLRPHARVRLEFVDEIPTTRAQIEPFLVNEDLESFEPYADTLFHGESLHLIKSVKQCDDHRLVAELSLSGEAKDWFESGKNWLAQAPLLDAVFQGAIVWCDLMHDSRCLPSKFEDAKFYQDWVPQDAVLDLVIESANAHSMRANARVFGVDGLLIAEIRGFEATLDSSLAESFTLRTLPAFNETASRKDPS